MKQDRKLKEIDSYNSLYSNDQSPSSGRMRDFVLRASEEKFCELLRTIVPGKRVLEIGCGDAKHSKMALLAGAKHVIASDLSEEALILAERTLSEFPNYSVLKLDSESPHLTDEVDVILNHEVFSSLDINAALPGLAKCLTPRGCLLSMETLGHNPIFNLKRKLNVVLGARTAWSAQHIWREEMFKVAERYFSIEETHYYHLLSLFFFPIYAIPSRPVREFMGSAINRADRFFLSSFQLKKLAFKIVFLMRRH